jgi:predicted nucleic acid-binding protein
LRIVVDSWAWVEILKLSEEGKEAKALLEEADEVFTPSLALAELARKYLREGVGAALLRRWLQGISEATEVCQIDIELAIESARVHSELSAKAQREKLGRPGLGDALMLATARATGAKLLTGDPHFKGLPETAWLGD